MPGVTGRVIKAAFVKFTTNSWHVAASVTKGAYFDSDGGLALRPAVIEEGAFGQTFINQVEMGDVEPPDLSLDAQARYDDHLYIWDSLVMGSPAVTISTSAAGQVTSWKHQLDLADSIDGLGVTLAFDKSVYVQELTSGKVYGFSEREDAGGRIKTTYQVLGSKPTVASATNTQSTVQGASFPALINRILRKHGTFRMAVASAGSLSATDAVEYSGMQVSMTRPQDRVPVGGQDYITAPGDNGFPTFEVRVTYPRMTTVAANSLITALAAGTVFKADLTYAGSYINSTDKYTKKYEWPNLQCIEHAASAAGADQVQPSATFRAYQATTSPTGMAFVRPLRLTRILVNSTAAF
jgi:hypothetical protein